MATTAEGLAERAAAGAAKLAELRQELEQLRAVKARADALAVAADGLGGAIDAQTRGVHHRVQREHQRRLQAETQEAHSQIKTLITGIVEEELSLPYRDGSEISSRFEAVIARADEALARDPYACLRRCGTRLYETWGMICLQAVLLVARLRPPRGDDASPAAAGGPHLNRR